MNSLSKEKIPEAIHLNEPSTGISPMNTPTTNLTRAASANSFRPRSSGGIQ